jgi:translation initiation factor IF-1
MGVRKIDFQFRTVLSEVEANLIKTGIFLPPGVIRELPKGRVRVEGTMNGAPFALAVLHMKDGSRFFSVSASLRKAAKVKPGDRVDVRFKVVDPDKIDIPEELDAVLAQDEQAMKAWNGLTTGYRRSLIHYVTSVKNVDSRIKRSIDLMERAKAGLLHGQKKSSSKK